MSRARPWYGDRWGPSDLHDEAEARGEGPEQRRIILMEFSQGRWPLNDQTLDPRTRKPIGLVQRIADVVKRRGALRVVIEDMNRGHDTAAELRRELHGYDIDVELMRPSGSKLNRMLSVQPLFANQLVYSPANLVLGVDKWGRAEVRVEEFQWVQELVRQAARCPRGRQDGADALSMGLAVLRRDGWLELTNEFVRSQIEAKAWRPKAGAIGRSIAREYGVV